MSKASIRGSLFCPYCQSDDIEIGEKKPYCINCGFQGKMNEEPIKINPMSKKDIFCTVLMFLCLILFIWVVGKVE
jgi:hypothetical protein